MKIRKGFVSNSSSSSFICDVCNHVESGWDMCLSEAGISQCEKGHTFCNDHIAVNITNEQKEQWVISQLSEKIKEMQESEYYAKCYTTEQRKERVEKLQDRITEVEKEDCNIEDELNDLEFNYYFPQEFCPECLRLKKEQDARDNYSKDPQWQLYLELKEKFENL